MGAQAVRLSNIDIDNALEKRHFELLFQPIFDLSNGALARVETFVRWRHETLGLLPPGAFISFFETQGRMSELTRYVLEQTLDSYLSWRGPYKPGFSINLALSDLTDESFVSHFAVLLREKNFPAELVTLECPMPPVTMEEKTAVACFERLSGTGARLAIEVRGRANDLVRTLNPFPFAEIKTGGAAILRFARTVRGPGLSAISELLELAEERNAAITAVGVEDQASLSALKGLNFDAAQGNHLGRVGLLKDFKLARVNEVRELLDLSPLPKTDLESLFRTESPEAETESKTAVPKKERVKKTKRAARAKAPKQLGEVSEQELVDRLHARLAEDSNNKNNIVEKRKAAAIKRARQKQSLYEDQTENADAITSDLDRDVVQNTLEPHDLQNLLSKEFEEDTATEAAGPDTTKCDETPQLDTIISDHEHIQSETDKIEDPKEKAPNEPQTKLDVVSPPSIAEDISVSSKDDQKPAPTKTEAKEPAIEDDKREIEAEKTPDVPQTKNHPTADESPSSMKQEFVRPTLGRLSISHARAFFKPSIRVAGPEAVSVEELYDNFESENSTAKKIATVPSETVVPESFTDDSTNNETETTGTTPHLQSVQDVIPPTADTKSNDDGVDDAVPPLDNEEPDFISALRQVHEEKKKARVGFLKRKHRIFSGYFWPRSWRKAWAAKRESKSLTDNMHIGS